MAPNRLQLLSGLMLLAVIPVALYVMQKSAEFVALSAVSVVLVAISLYLMFDSSESESVGEAV